MAGFPFALIHYATLLQEPTFLLRSVHLLRIIAWPPVSWSASAAYAFGAAQGRDASVAGSIWPPPGSRCRTRLRPPPTPPAGDHRTAPSVALRLAGPTRWTLS